MASDIKVLVCGHKKNSTVVNTLLQSDVRYTVRWI
jgi:hypothetical protein